MISMDIEARYLELYFLSSPFANVIGCYRIADAIAAVEVGMDKERFACVVERLVERGIIFRHFDYVLVSRWFYNHVWESVLKGSVATKAIQEFKALPEALKEQWIKTTLEAGVPSNSLAEITPLTSPPIEASEGGVHITDNSTQTKIPTQTKCVSKTGRLILSPKVERHRNLIERETASFDQFLAQEIADELAGALMAAEAGNRPKILNIPRWLSAVIDSVESGAFRPECGVFIAREREVAIKNDIKRANERSEDMKSKHLLDRRVDRAEKALLSLTNDDLKSLARQVETSIILPSAKTKTVSSLLSRQVPRGPSCIDSLNIIESYFLVGVK